jgi:hypothetical protein
VTGGGGCGPTRLVFPTRRLDILDLKAALVGRGLGVPFPFFCTRLANELAVVFTTVEVSGPMV